MSQLLNIQNRYEQRNCHWRSRSSEPNPLMVLCVQSPTIIHLYTPFLFLLLILSLFHVPFSHFHVFLPPCLSTFLPLPSSLSPSLYLYPTSETSSAYFLCCHHKSEIKLYPTINICISIYKALMVDY